MSSTVSEMGITSLADDFLAVHYKQAISNVVTGQTDTLEIDYGDLEGYWPELADKARSNYLDAAETLREAAKKVDLPIPPKNQRSALDNATVGITNLPEENNHSPLSLMKNGAGGQISLTGDLSKVSVPKEKCVEAGFECINDSCNHTDYVPMGDDWQPMMNCEMCKKKTMAFREHLSTFKPYCKLRVETPPSERGELQDEHTDVVVEGDLVWHGSNAGLVGRAGEPVTVYGDIERIQPDDNKPLFEKRVSADYVQFRTNNVELNPADFKAEFEEFANAEDPIELWKESLVPELYATPAWDVGLELLVTYLFGAPRVDIPDGPTFRGDIHLLIISGYGMGKSMVNEAVADYSPKCIKESVTGLSSDVGLLAAAVEDDFGDSQWTLQPGILVRGNGGHVILDEIDKTDADLERMNDALEGQQVVDINKAGQTASFDSKCGVLATGNPKDDRFTPEANIRDEIDIEPSLLSRFDGIITMRDEPDPDMDKNIARTAGGALVEGLEYQYGTRSEFDQLERTITPEIGRNWVHYAREHIDPIPTQAQIDRVSEWYANEARQLNAGKDRAPVPVNARHVHAVLRRAMAYSRMRLTETVADADIERAMEIQKTLISQDWDGNAFVPVEFRTKTQGDQIRSLKDIIRELSDPETPADRDAVLDKAERVGMDRQKAVDQIQQLKDQGQITEPQIGETLRVV